MKYIEFFSSISKADKNRFGGKVATLGDMYQSGIPVPNGFGISIEAHKEFNDKPFNEGFKTELHQAFKHLKTQRVAVRSSAIAEDAKDASWAGQLESYLNTTEGELEAKVRMCWRSIESEHAKDYAKDKNISQDSLLVGVVVQAMIDPESAGVMFTNNPVTKNQDEIMIEAAYGLGEMVVQGLVTPDNLIVDKIKNKVVHFGVSIKEQKMIYDNGENKVVPVPEEFADRAVLREAQVLELAKLGSKIEKHFKTPQDIEWALQSGKFYIVQARPITTL
jgi:pyruvate,water dikinase